MESAVPAGMHTRTAIHFLEQARKFLIFERDTHPTEEITEALETLHKVFGLVRSDHLKKAPWEHDVKESTGNVDNGSEDVNKKDESEIL